MTLLNCGCDTLHPEGPLCDTGKALWARLVIHEFMRPDEAHPRHRSRSVRLAEAAFDMHITAAEEER